jgi:hypothetical protein
MNRFFFICESILLAGVILISAIWVPWAIDTSNLDMIVAIVFAAEVFNILVMMIAIHLLWYFKLRKISDNLSN